MGILANLIRSDLFTDLDRTVGQISRRHINPHDTFCIIYDIGVCSSILMLRAGDTCDMERCTATS